MDQDRLTWQLRGYHRSHRIDRSPDDESFDLYERGHAHLAEHKDLTKALYAQLEFDLMPDYENVVTV